jgi:RNA polymerase sigma-54 factor
MALTQKLEVRQSQALVMTPQLMQAIKLLQLSNLDLVAYVEGELERNPLLDRAVEGEAEAGAPAEPDARPEEPSGAADWNGQDLEVSRGAIEERLGTGLDNVFPDDAGAAPARPGAEAPMAYSQWAGVGAGGREDSEYNLEAFVSAEETLADHLAEQLALAIVDPARRMIGQYLIDLVDEAGYLTGDLAAVADKLGAPPGEVEAVLAVLQGFEPLGVCARDLPECLAIQLKERDRYDPAMQALVANLDLLARRDVAALRKLCGVDEEDLAEMIGEIRRLNPKPGLAFGSTLVQPIVPDVFVRPGPDGGWLVELNSDTLPRILVNQTYHAEVSRTARGDSEKA